MRCNRKSPYGRRPTVTIAATHNQLHAANQTATQQAGQIQLANFQNPPVEQPGNGLYTPRTLPETRRSVAGGPEGRARCYRLRRTVNTSIVNEFINLIQAQRGYEANSKVVTRRSDCTSR